MNNKTIYIIRHGETDFNKQGVVQGSGIDAELNATGKSQAQAFFDKYATIPFDKIYISTLIRTKQSVEKFIALGIPFETNAGLNEMNWGIKEGKKIENVFDNFYADLIENWQNGNTSYATIGGESPEDVAKRLQSVIDLILARPHEKIILVAMHGRALRILLSLLLNHPLKAMDRFEHSNLSLYKLNYDIDSKRFSIILGNDTTHLQP